MIATSRLMASQPPSSVGRAKRQKPAASARRRTSPSSSSHSALGIPPRSTVGARELAPVVEEAGVVALCLERPDLALDELVERGDPLLDLLRNREIHRGDDILRLVISSTRVGRTSLVEAN